MLSRLSTVFFGQTPFRLAVIAALTGLIAIGGVASARPAAATAVVDISAEVEYAAVGLINQERQAAGVGGLNMASGLQEVAELRAQDMAANDYLSHYNAAGIGAERLLDEHGISRSITGENIGRAVDPSGYSVMDVLGMLHDAFMRSDKHRDNVLDGRFSQVGVGMAQANGKYYIAVVFTD